MDAASGTDRPHHGHSSELREGRVERLAGFADRHAFLLYGGVVGSFLLLFLAAVFLLTVEADESWILLSTAHAFGVPVPLTDAFGRPTITTGGLHLLLHGLLARVTTSIVIHRLISTVTAALLFLLVYRICRSLRHPRSRAMAGAALFATVPGFVLQAGLAMGEVIAVVFLIGAGLHWIRRGALSLRAAAVTGLLLGLAFATRVNCAAAAGGLIAYAIVAPHPNWQRLSRALLAVLVAMVVLAVSVAFYYYVGSTPAAGEQAAHVATATGIGSGRKSVFQIVQALLMMNEFLPILLLVLIAAAWIVRRVGLPGAEEEDDTGDLAGIMLLMGLAILAAWILFAPIPHLRYLWPALVCIWMAGIVLFLDVWLQAKRAVTRLTLHGVVGVACGYALLAGVFMVGHGESLTLVYRAMGLSARPALPRGDWFRAARDQRALASFIASQPMSAHFYTLYAPGAYPVVYLSGRSIPNSGRMSDAENRFLILLPADHAVWQPSGAYSAWKKAYTRPVFRSGDFAILRVDDRAPVPPQEMLSVGMSDIYLSGVDVPCSFWTTDNATPKR